MNNYIFNRSTLLFGTILASAMIVSQCATFDSLTRGTILKHNGNEYYVCIGSDDGAKEGQLYSVYAYKENPELRDSADFLEKIYTGTIKIASIVHKHYAKAVLVSGKVSRGEIVELKR